MTSKNVTLRVENFDELRDSLHQTGLFEMADCIVEISCSMDSSVSEVQKMFSFIKTTINVVDTTVITDNELENYKVQLREVEPPFTRGPARRARKS
jgi:DNA polymerase III alpha subunit (gram-positive type)